MGNIKIKEQQVYVICENGRFWEEFTGKTRKRAIERWERETGVPWKTWLKDERKFSVERIRMVSFP